MARRNPQRLAIYKGLTGKYGAVQFNLQRPHYYCPICKKKDFESVLPKTCTGYEDAQHKPTEMQSREGCIFLEIASATGPNEYDWSKEKKITMALSITDMSKLLFTCETGTDCKIFHDPGAKSALQGKVAKTLNASCTSGDIQNGLMLSVSMKEQGKQESIKHTVPLDGSETKMLSVFLRGALLSSLDWQ